MLSTISTFEDNSIWCYQYMLVHTAGISSVINHVNYHLSCSQQNQLNYINFVD